MSFERRVRCLIAAGIVLLLVAGCSPRSHSPQIAYRDAESERPLEVPPDLTRPDSTAAMTIPQLDKERQVLPEFRDVTLTRAGSSTWLEVRGGSPEDIWPRVKAFLRSEGLRINTENPATGTIETAWAQRYDSPERTGLGGFFNRLLGAGGTGIQDRYQFRLERMAGAGGTRVFVTHWMAEEEARGDSARDHAGYEMRRSSGDPAVVTEIQRRLLIYLGVQEERARQIAGADGTGTDDDAPGAAYEERDGVAFVTLGDHEAPGQVWPRVGDALSRVGAHIANADSDTGIYRIAWVPPRDATDSGGGLFSNLFGGEDGVEPQDLVVQVRGDQGPGRIVVAGPPAELDSDATTGIDGVPASSVADKALLQRLADALNGTFASRTVPVDGRDSDAGGRRGADALGRDLGRPASNPPSGK